MSSRQRVSFGYKPTNSRKNNLKPTAQAFMNQQDEQYIDFSQQNKKRTRE
jgi:hypothetical protein